MDGIQLSHIFEIFSISNEIASISMEIPSILIKMNQFESGIFKYKVFHILNLKY